MKTQGRVCAAAAALLLGACAAGVAAAVEPAADGAPTSATTYTVETTASYHAVDHPYFGASDRRDAWGEAFSRVRVTNRPAKNVVLGVGGVLMGTAGRDYFGAHDVGDGRLDQLYVGVSDVGGTGVGIVAGRQDLVLGDGFLIGDGFRDTRAALWNIPLNFYDAVKVEWKDRTGHALLFGANLSRSWGGGGVYPKGQIFGAELGITPDEGSDITLTYLRRNDTSPAKYDPSAFSLRGAWSKGAVALSGEGVLEGGTSGAGPSLRGRGGHVRAVVTGAGRWKPTLRAEYFHFSGDDPGTAGVNEAYYPWQFRWNDWSQYYVGDLVASTIATASDMRMALAQVGVTPREGTGVRLIAHHMDLDREPSPGASRAFATEFDLVVDQSLGANLTGWVMGAYTAPLAAAKAAWGGAAAGQVFASVTYKFGGAIGH